MTDAATTDRLESTFRLLSWDESTVEGDEGGRRLTRAVVRYAYEGAIEGESKAVYSMCYATSRDAEFAAYERIEGRVNGHPASLTLEHRGVVVDGVVKVRWRVMPESIEGELERFEAEGEGELVHGESYSMRLERRPRAG